jgi:hypothetical protein
VLKVWDRAQALGTDKGIKLEEEEIEMMITIVTVQSA